MKTFVLAGAVALAVALPGSAMAKDAWCYSSDDGEYACNFKSLDANGSFEISADGMPTFLVWIDTPGQAFVSAIFGVGTRAVSLPGTYYRSEEDGACWVSDATDTEICAW